MRGRENSAREGESEDMSSMWPLSARKWCINNEVRLRRARQGRIPNPFHAC